jgi:hypothetical protein
MIGFVVSKEQAQAANDAVTFAQTSRGLPVFWLPGQYHLFTGQYAGMTFVPCSDSTLSSKLIGNPARTPMDFQEFAEIVALLGGLESRVSVDPQDIIDPDAPQEP